jgi:hypothetical protein
MIKFTEKPRRVVCIEIRCYATSGIFKKWEILTQQEKEEIQKNGPTPCNSGIPGEHCVNCRFGYVNEYGDEE